MLSSLSLLDSTNVSKMSACGAKAHYRQLIVNGTDVGDYKACKQTIEILYCMAVIFLMILY